VELATHNSLLWDVNTATYHGLLATCVSAPLCSPSGSHQSDRSLRAVHSGTTTTTCVTRVRNAMVSFTHWACGPVHLTWGALSCSFGAMPLMPALSILPIDTAYPDEACSPLEHRVRCLPSRADARSQRRVRRWPLNPLVVAFALSGRPRL
jgi:hypothetical protein